jgi:hypothetical protein
MIPIEGFTLENKQDSFEQFRSRLEPHGFIVSGNWDYDHGFLDRVMNEEKTVYIRVPFEVTQGEFDGESTNENTVVRIGTPFVLKHQYEEGLDQDADTGLVSGTLDQFQSPVNKDAPVEDHWIQEAKEVLQRI